MQPKKLVTLSSDLKTEKPYFKLHQDHHGYMVELWNGHNHFFFHATTEYLATMYFAIEKKIVSSDAEEKKQARAYRYKSNDR
jgi:hypothetical protein